MNVKICGIQDIETARHTAASGADFIGFVFAESSRKITPEKAQQIAQSLPDTIQKVGVFVNEPIATVNQVAAFVGLDVIQLHGDETPDYCNQLNLPITKSFQIQDKKDLDRLQNYKVDYYLLDSPSGKYRGGSGKSFDWSLLKNTSISKNNIILAGGLHSENIQYAIDEVGPAMVDVSSGVETNGKKDFHKISTFIQQAKRKNKEMNL